MCAKKDAFPSWTAGEKNGTVFVLTVNFVFLHDSLSSYKGDDSRAVLWIWERISG